MSQTPAQELELLKKRLDTLNQARTRAQVELETANRQAAELAAEAEAAYGTSNVEQLRQMLADKESENRTRLQVFASGLESAEASLRQVEAALANK